MNFMSKVMSDEELKNLTNSAINEVKMLLVNWRESEDVGDRKSAKILSFWLKQYVKYLKEEKNFNPAGLKEYSRGDIIKVNLGYNVGSEEGGLHYAIVVSNCNTRQSPTINVIPLTSKNEGKSIHPDDVFLGNEIYEKLSAKFKNISDDLSAQIEALQEKNNKAAFREAELRRMIAEAENVDVLTDDFVRTLNEMVNEAQYMQREIQTKIDEATKSLNEMKKINNEVSNMKMGSIALVSQITTVSKMKIYDPKSDHDVLAGIKLSNTSLDLLNEKVKQIFVR